MNTAFSLAAGKVIALAWRNPRLRRELLQHPEQTLQKHLGVAVPKAVSIRFLRNTDRVVHLVVGATAAAAPPSLLLELKRYWESYSDPRLEPLAWCARDPVVTHRLVANPRLVMEQWGIALPRLTEIRVVANSPSMIHMVLPAPPAGARLRAKLARSIKLRGAPTTLKYASLVGLSDYRTLLAEG